MSNFPEFEFPLARWIDIFVDWLATGWRFAFFRFIGEDIILRWLLVPIEHFLLWLPPGIFIVALALTAWQTSSKSRRYYELGIILGEAIAVAVGITLLTIAQEQANLLLAYGAQFLILAAFLISAIFWVWRKRKPGVADMVIYSLFFVGVLGLWDEAMRTVAVVGVAALISVVIALPVGIIMAKSDRMETLIRPFLDGMQTMPSFVYLVPALMLFGLGKVPAVIATVIYATPPGIRLTNLGIRLVPAEMLEAADAFGVTSRQMLLKVQLPLALPTIMAGVNQVIMASLAMVVIASLVGAAGLGLEVLHGIARLEVGKGFAAGISITLLAIIFDRITRDLGQGQQRASDGSS